MQLIHKYSTNDSGENLKQTLGDCDATISNNKVSGITEKKGSVKGEVRYYVTIWGRAVKSPKVLSLWILKKINEARAVGVE